MLTLTKLADAEYTLTQVAEGIEEYYLGIGEAPGVWHGRWAARLGLEGVVVGDDLRSLLDGFDPTSGADLVAGDTRRTVKAFDATFSAPKSVSVLWAFATPHISSVISIAHTEAVTQAMSLLEDKSAVARQQRDGVRSVVATEGLAAAAFTHRTSRDGDPQLHTHCVIPNVVRRADGTHVSLAGHGLWEWKKAVGGVYQEQLRRLLTERLGLEWGPDRNGCREIVGFTPAQLRMFSKRAQQIEQRLEATGVDREDRVAWMRADEKASLATRPAKDKTLTPARLQERWRDEAARVGIPLGLELEAAVTSRTVEQPTTARDEVFARLVDPEVGLCARRARFGPADVVEHIAAMDPGQLTVAEVEQLADQFLASGLAVRLVDRDTDTGHRQPRCWSTARHLELERHVLEQLGRLSTAAQPGTDLHKIEAAIANAKRLGDDQAEAVRVLCGPGPAVRALIAPAGYGKTTTVAAAANAQQAAGRPVLAVAPTNQAVHELRAAGLNASTIARLRIDVAHAPLPSGAVLIVDEMSQVATADAAWLLETVASVPGGQVWLLGDSHQTGPVAAGGLAHEIERLADAGTIPAARLIGNRRQQDPLERQALEQFRRGDVAASQHLRDEHGWEHDHGEPVATRSAMAAAVVDDIDRLGLDQVVALAVSHADCEDLADRIRAQLAEQGRLGPTLAAGPAWHSGERHYAAGDRILIHDNIVISGFRWTNGMVVTVHGLSGHGLSASGPSGQRRVLPGWFIAGRRPDGSPSVSHAWVRTVDGAQGGTWTQVHLLATQNLDATTAYVGQSRGRYATHTWNVGPHDDGDHGGVNADRRDPAEQVLAAMEREPDRGFAAHDDPWHLDGLLSRERAEHVAVIAGRPHYSPDQDASARRELRYAEHELEQAQWRLGLRHQELDAIGPLARLHRSGRDRVAAAERALERGQRDATNAEQRVAAARAALADAGQAHQANIAWQVVEGWRYDRVAEIDHQLAEHWTEAVLAAVRQGDPLAYGLDKLRQAHHHAVEQLAAVDAALPEDRTGQLAGAQATQQHLRTNLAHAQRRLEAARDKLAAVTPGWGRRERVADAERQLADAQHDRNATQEQLVAAERTLRREQAAVETRQDAVDASADRRQHLEGAVRDLSTSVREGRRNRVLAAAAGRPGQDHLHAALGPAPAAGPGRDIWCAIAERIEHHRDHNQPGEPQRGVTDMSAVLGPRPTDWNDAHQWDRLAQLIGDAPELIELAQTRPPVAAIRDDPAAWQQTLDQAIDVHARTIDRGMSLGR